MSGIRRRPYSRMIPRYYPEWWCLRLRQEGTGEESVWQRKSRVLFFFCNSSVQSLSLVWLSVTPWIAATPGFPVHHQLPELTQTHAHRVSDAIQASHPLSSPPLRDSKYWCPPGLSLWPSFSSNFNLSLSYAVPSNGYKCHQHANDSQIYFFSCDGLKTCPQIFCCTSYQTWNTIPLPLNMSQP